MKKNVCSIGSCSNEVPEHRKACGPCTKRHKRESIESHENELESLIPLHMHSGKDNYRKIERVNRQKLVEKTRIIQSSERPRVRWICLVNNYYTNAVILSHEVKRGLCTCKDFEKNRKVYKHMLAAMVKIGKEQGKSLTREF
jgi:hypothetical protein